MGERAVATTAVSSLEDESSTALDEPRLGCLLESDPVLSQIVVILPRAHEPPPAHRDRCTRCASRTRRRAARRSQPSIRSPARPPQRPAPAPRRRGADPALERAMEGGGVGEPQPLRDLADGEAAGGDVLEREPAADLVDQRRMADAHLGQGVVAACARGRGPPPPSRAGTAPRWRAAGRWWPTPTRPDCRDAAWTRAGRRRCAPGWRRAADRRADAASRPARAADGSRSRRRRKPPGSRTRARARRRRAARAGGRSAPATSRHRSLAGSGRGARPARARRAGAPASERGERGAGR